MKFPRKFLLPAALMALHGVAGSATATGTLLVTATVSVTCANGTSYSVALDGGG